MIAPASLLVELGTEELPPKSLRTLSEAFLQALSKSLLGAGLIGKPDGKPFAGGSMTEDYEMGLRTPAGGGLNVSRRGKHQKHQPTILNAQHA